jgi:hypothetical protein
VWNGLFLQPGWLPRLLVRRGIGAEAEAQQHTTFAHDHEGGRERTCLAGDFEDFRDHFGAPAATIASALLLSSSSAESLTTNAIMPSLPAPGAAAGLLFVLMPVGRGEGDPPLPLDGP